MNRLITRTAAGTSAMAMIAAVAPTEAGAQDEPLPEGAEGTTTTSEGGLPNAEDVLNEYDLTTAEGVQRFLEDRGLSRSEVQAVARDKFDYDVDSFYAIAAENFRNNREDPSADSELPIEFDGSTIHYNNNLSGAMEFEQTRTWQQAGTRVGDGCDFDNIEFRVNEDYEHGVAEVIELDTERCIRTIFEGEYDPDSGPQTLDYDPENAPQFLNCSDLTEPPTTYDPDYDTVDGEYRFHFKEAFVDPVCISITSTTQNIRWKNAIGSDVDVTLLPGTTGEYYYFEQLGESWPDDRITIHQYPGQDESSTGNGYDVESLLQHTRWETQFPENLAITAAILGSAPLAAAVIACEGDFSDTYFESYQSLIPEHTDEDGTAWIAYEGNTDGTGGCINLVHHRWWWGWGAYAR